MLTTTEDKELEAARKEVVAADRVCPSCKARFVSTGATLRTWNGAVGLEGHACPACGHLVLARRDSPDGL